MYCGNVMIIRNWTIHISRGVAKGIKTKHRARNRGEVLVEIRIIIFPEDKPTSIIFSNIFLLFCHIYHRNQTFLLSSIIFFSCFSISHISVNNINCIFTHLIMFFNLFIFHLNSLWISMIWHSFKTILISFPATFIYINNCWKF